MTRKTIAAGKFKATCLRLMDQIQRTREPWVVTKNGVPVVKIVPAQEVDSGEVLGCMRDTIRIEGDIVSPAVDPREWEANRS